MDKEQAIQLLGAGIGTSAVAEIVGCEPSYISQLADQHSEEIAALRQKNTARFISRDELLETAEQAALERTAQMIPFITKPGEAVRVYGILNSAKRALAGQQATTQAPAAIVNITLSVAAAQQLTKTHDNQVIEVNRRSMVPLASKQVNNMLSGLQAARLLATKVPASLVDKL